MRIGIAAPVETSSIVDLLGASARDAPAGYRGAPIIGVLARELVERGHEVTLYTTDSSLLPIYRDPLVIHGDRITVYYCPSRVRSFYPKGRMLGRMVDFFRFERKGLLKAMQASKPDIVHAHWAYEFAWAALDSGLPNVITFHDAPRQILQHMPSLYRLGRYWMSLRVAREAKNLTTVSPYMRDELLSWCGRSIELVSNPVADEWFKLARPILVRKLGTPKIAMVINGWSSLKNPEPALKAFAKIVASIPLAELHLFGKDFGPNEYAENWCRSRGMVDGIKFHGLIPYSELQTNLAQMDLLIHPALEESFGMSLAEAMALAIPVVAGKSSGAVPWVCADGKAGALVDVSCESEIANAALHIFESSSKYSKIAFAAQESARDRFSAASVVDAYEILYAKAITEAAFKC